MADDAIPSISSGSVGSRFVSQTDLETAKARRDEQWKAAYARYACTQFPTTLAVGNGRQQFLRLAHVQVSNLGILAN